MSDPLINPYAAPALPSANIAGAAQGTDSASN
jgi:hypothetical protein